MRSWFSWSWPSIHGQILNWKYLEINMNAFFYILHMNISDRYSTIYYWQLMWSHTWAFDWYIYICRWPIVKVKDKVIHISTMNILELVDDRLKIVQSRICSSVYFLFVKAWFFCTCACRSVIHFWSMCYAVQIMCHWVLLACVNYPRL